MTIRIVVVDDDAGALMLLTKILEMNDVVVTAADRANKALDLTKTNEYDLVLLDIMMPDINGLQLCSMMRNQKGMKATPIYFVTAYNSMDMENQARIAGADGVVNKPINIEKIKKLLRMSLKSQLRKFD